jgi:16S rRNA G1207 methylase RsmC
MATVINPNKTPSGILLDEIRAITLQHSDRVRFYNFMSKNHVIPIVALPTVYLSDDFGDTRYFVEIVPDFAKGRFLEIGSGTGVLTIAITIINSGFFRNTSNKYIAVDINPKAVKNTKINAIINEIEDWIDVRESDVFSSINGDEKFDCIFWNHPFHIGKKYEDLVQRACFDPMFQGFEQYVRSGHDYLNPEGKLLLGSGNFADLALMREILDKYGCKMDLLHYVHRPFNATAGDLKTFNLYEIIQK